MRCREVWSISLGSYPSALNELGGSNPPTATIFKMNKLVTNEIKRFYLAKKFKGKIINNNESFLLFNVKRWLYCGWVSTDNFLVSEIILITKEKFIEKFPNWVIPQKLTGIELYPVESKYFSWWELEQYSRRKMDGIFIDIEENHISKTIKYRHSVIYYLRSIRANNNQYKQIKLPGF